MYNLLNANVGKPVLFYIGSTYMATYGNNWYILPFLTEDMMRVISLPSANANQVSDSNTVVTDTTFTAKGKNAKHISHFRISALTSITIGE